MTSTDIRVRVGLSAVILAVTDEVPRVLTVENHESGRPALPFGPLDPMKDRTLELGLRAWVREQTSLELGYAEQLYTFGDRDRDPYLSSDGRVISVAYLALVREVSAASSSAASWRDVYAFLPWEDWREGHPRAVADLLPPLRRWARDGDAPRDRRPRFEIAFGQRASPWDPERVLDRYELLWEAGLVPEAPGHDAPEEARAGRPMALDHRRMLATALGRLRSKLRYRPVVFELMPDAFTLFQLQRVVEALAGVRLHKQNFRRLLEKGGLVERTGAVFTETGGRPAELFRFRPEVVRERPSAGVSFPTPSL